MFVLNNDMVWLQSVNIYILVKTYLIYLHFISNCAIESPHRADTYTNFLIMFYSTKNKYISGCFKGYTCNEAIPWSLTERPNKQEVTLKNSISLCTFTQLSDVRTTSLHTKTPTFYSSRGELRKCLITLTAGTWPNQTRYCGWWPWSGNSFFFVFKTSVNEQMFFITEDSKQFFPQPRGRLGGGKAWLYCRQKEECNLIKENLHALTHHTYFRNGSKNILLYADSDFQGRISGNYLRFEGYKCL